MYTEKNNPYKFPPGLVVTHPCIVKNQKHQIIEGISMDDEMTQEYIKKSIDELLFEREVLSPYL